MTQKLFKPFISETARTNVQRVLLTDAIAEGEEVKLFEKEFGEKFNKTNVVAVNSGTSALELAYELAGIGEGDEVIVPILTCTATAIPLIRRKAKIVFADIDRDLNINIQDVKNKITDKTKAIVFVHFGGNNRGLTDIIELARDRGIIVVEDAAQAVGSECWGISDFTCVSLQAIKTLTAGDGGFLLTKNEEDYKKAKRLRWFGYDREEKQRLGDIDLTEAGYKYHMNNITAAIGRGNLAEIDTPLAHRKLIGDIYKLNGLFAHAWLAGIVTPFRDLLRAKLAEAGYESGMHHYRLDKYTLFKEFKSPCPIMDELENQYLFVPYHHAVTPVEALAITRIVKKYGQVQ